jgi:undecaprenyl-diphosphatase
MFYLDLLFNQWMQEIQYPILTKILLFITHIGDPLPMILFSLILLFALVYKKRYKEFALTAFILVLGISICELIKLIVQRARPQDALLILKDTSFPSNHAAMSTLFFLILIFLYKDKIKNKILKKTFITISFLLFLLIGFSRLYLNIHWFTDVIFGFLLGTLLVYLFLVLKNRTKK